MNPHEKVIARDRDHLLQLIEEAFEKEGYDCDLNFIDVSQVTDMHDLFADRGFRGNISEWDVSNVTDMAYMFCLSQFNGDISKWNVSKMANVGYMFENSVLEKAGEIPAWYK